MTVAAWPVGTTESGIGQPCESAKHDDVESKKQRHPDELAVFVAILRRPDDNECEQRNQQTFGCKLEQQT
jgi:hypothetical protein